MTMICVRQSKCQTRAYFQFVAHVYDVVHSYHSTFVRHDTLMPFDVNVDIKLYKRRT